MRRMQGAAIALVAVALSVFAHAQTAPPEEPTRKVIHGHVVANIASMAFGAGLGPKWSKFIFSVEQKGGPKLVLVEYAFLVSRLRTGEARIGKIAVGKSPYRK